MAPAAHEIAAVTRSLPRCKRPAAVETVFLRSVAPGHGRPDATPAGTAAASDLLSNRLKDECLMKRATRIATRRRQLSLPRRRGELVSLLQRLRDKIDECLDDVGVGREPSRNRESSHRA